ncbi:bifunctional 23S rRNA (guanine(2069)-N(7))-methyltransferase RlmK/23S rRNA (guanine(2445)-N(2))-methyltransferase RlmL [Ferrimonas balearica]|uniref:bifunctional 23S rRNA (guanine(2069)-N(7))-methyltransferase RlmK/23S rRNA (guanine(2445)-N(2))-methyltransferase RlmL n=1 Tax=Ferrimonas balearica TaxID=44012 RepID=UPI001C9A0964|nr:bifunctional 23S rRNA (guanine(2069)-N(7))-methyltransferase RlmK/23S rRNA (guanine(2445)-N(2))-methyltransferase RlmL [Ferrimonas balearica]MBY5991588.1 bifunctional 23S rRNA (guanine(2069)-N(7))-methyltransferase RlmK/23S rRNA (guanine(2445)-N(2))-methyltransferase RlmL [Ferrimonas balearica]
MKRFYAATPKGLEYLLVDELVALGASEVREGQAVVHFEAELDTAYRICLWSRLASRVVLVLDQVVAKTADQLYDGVKKIYWPGVFTPHSDFMVDFHGGNREIRNSQFGALKVKDAIVDAFVEHAGTRPTVSKERPAIRIDCALRADKLLVGLNLSGSALHQRGYRLDRGRAPLRENLAAAVLMRSGWTQAQDKPLIDPFCGSGTVLIEAALMATDTAPQLHRRVWGFDHWVGHQPQRWNAIREEALERAQAGEARCQTRFIGRDINRRVLAIAKDNAERAGMADFIQFEGGDVNEMPPPPANPGFVVSNPPYGERLGQMPELLHLYASLGRQLKEQWQGWQVSLLCSDPMLLSALRLKADKQYKLYNGALEVLLGNYAVGEGGAGRQYGEDFANRLRKNLKQLKKWVKQEGIDSYRVYDADLPEYNVAIDRYQDWVVVQEYAPPKSVPEHKARQRLIDVLLNLPEVLEVDPSQIVVKERKQQKGKEQYEKLDQSHNELKVEEYGARFLVNLTDYLDTGLFLDHRLARRYIQEHSQGKRFLNLFAYTGSASVHAALGGARATTTVDMSKTYLRWAQDNFALNRLKGREHRFVHADCLAWLSECQEQFDFIFIDPPTFSNSKRMEQSFDVQRDHLWLLTQLKRMLAPGGEILFSNNKRHFKMDEAGVEALGLNARNVTKQTQSPDFARNKQIHNAWVLHHADA